MNDLLTFQFQFSQGIIQRNLEGVDETLANRTDGIQGANINWLVGHIVMARGGLHGFLGGEPFLSTELAEAYGRGSKPSATPAGAWDELLRLLDESAKTLTAALSAASEESLLEPIDPGFIPVFEGPTPRVQILGFLIAHEIYHAGQLGTLRRAVGLGGAI